MDPTHLAAGMTPSLESRRVDSAYVLVGQAGALLVDLELAPDRFHVNREQGLLVHANHSETDAFERLTLPPEARVRSIALTNFAATSEQRPVPYPQKPWPMPSAIWEGTQRMSVVTLIRTNHPSNGDKRTRALLWISMTVDYSAPAGRV